MATLTKEQTQLIREEIARRGISQTDLEEDLLDHVCTAVENEMASGENFEQAYTEVMSRFPARELKQVQVKTEALLDGKKIYYPNIGQSFGLVLRLIFLYLILTFVIINPVKSVFMYSIKDADPDLSLTINIVINGLLICSCMLLVILFAKLELKERSFMKVNILPLRPVPFSIFLLITGIVLLSCVWMEMLTYLIPVPDSRKELLVYALSHYPPLPMFFLLIIFWPVLSEVLFRGIMLKGMLRKYTPLKAIFWSSLLFSVILMDPYRVPAFFLMGIFCGWLFYHTHSLAPSIFAHAISGIPSVLYVSWITPKQYEQLFILKNIIGHEGWYYSLGVASLLLTVFLLWRLKKKFAQPQYVSAFSLE